MTTQIVARETQSGVGLSSTATVTVQLTDVNDNFPRFDQTIYRESVREDRPVGHYIATITVSVEECVFLCRRCMYMYMYMYRYVDFSCLCSLIHIS